jgi:hypothetical protein
VNRGVAYVYIDVKTVDGELRRRRHGGCCPAGVERTAVKEARRYDMAFLDRHNGATWLRVCGQTTAADHSIGKVSREQGGGFSKPEAKLGLELKS